MNLFRLTALAAAAFMAVCQPVAAQWQTPNHSVPVGRGAGFTGFGSAVPGTAGLPLVSNGPSADPSFQALAPLSSGIDQNILNAQSANYSIVAGDAGKVIYVTGGPFKVTLPSVSGFASNAVVTVCNGNPNNNTSHAVLLSGFPNPFFPRLYMQQCGTIAIENGAWAAKYFPGRFHPAFVPTWTVDNGGNDNNDGFLSNASGNALHTMAGCFGMAQIEYDFGGNIQPSCSPTGGQTLVGSFSLIGPLVGGTVINVSGNGGVAVLQATANAGFVMQLADTDGVGVITTNVTFDCTGGAAGCVNIPFHQVSVADLNQGTTLKGGGVGNIGMTCDSFCKINVGASPLVVTGSFSAVMTLDQNSVGNISSGLSLANGTTIASDIVKAAHGSSFLFAGALTAGTTVSVGELFQIVSGANGCLNANFSTSGAFGAARQWSVLNNGFFGNVSATAVPGSTPGINTATGFAPGIVANSGLNSGGC